mmetsp:Transcript_75711/g.119295  ORF Transcript_75711/g.119295 Transcript_75711/m.119295 type:complete len:299 (-) Transcript_75711:25-921(-)
MSTLFTWHSIGQSPQAAPPQLFVAVFTTRATPMDKRDSIRFLWQEVDGGQGNICARFVVCEAADAFQQSLQTEHATKGDFLFLPCQEGYAQGLLTRKVIATMKAYWQAGTTGDVCLNRPLFMKVDDDTFVAGNRFRQGLAMAHSMYGEFMFGGVDLPSQPPDRNPSSHWYEPQNIWPHENYPPAMYGGPGYILGRSMVQRIVDEGIADSFILWNEDRAVGVWVNALQQRGVFVNWVRIPGTNGFQWDKPTKSGPWGQYPYVLSHHLSKSCILCLTNVDRMNNPALPTDPCFQLEPLAG